MTGVASTLLASWVKTGSVKSYGFLSEQRAKLLKEAELSRMERIRSISTSPKLFHYFVMRANLNFHCASWSLLLAIITVVLLVRIKGLAEAGEDVKMVLLGLKAAFLTLLPITFRFIFNGIGHYEDVRRSLFYKEKPAPEEPPASTST